MTHKNIQYLLAVEIEIIDTMEKVRRHEITPLQTIYKLECALDKIGVVLRRKKEKTAKGIKSTIK